MSGDYKTVRRAHEAGDYHGLTFSCFRRMPLLTNDDWRGILAEAIDRAMVGQDCRRVAYAFMLVDQPV